MNAENFRANQVVVQHDVGRLKKFESFQRQQFRIARSRSHQIHLTRHDFAPRLIASTLISV